MLTDEQIAELTPDQRRELMGRLARPIQLPRRTVRAARRLRLLLTVVCVVVLVPWIGYLAATLPHHYRVHSWRLTWIGFDVGLLVLMVATLVLGVQRRLLVVLTGFATGVMLLCDAWFDVLTANRGDRPFSVLSALLVELPLGIVFTSGALLVVRWAAVRVWALEPGQSVWRLRLPG